MTNWDIGCTYQCLENLLLKAAKQEDFTEELQLAVSTYTSDIHKSNLQMQLQTLGSAVHEKVVNIFDVRHYRKILTPAESSNVQQTLFMA